MRAAHWLCSTCASACSCSQLQHLLQILGQRRCFCRHLRLRVLQLGCYLIDGRVQVGNLVNELLLGLGRVLGLLLKEPRQSKALVVTDQGLGYLRPMRAWCVRQQPSPDCVPCNPRWPSVPALQAFAHLRREQEAQHSKQRPSYDKATDEPVVAGLPIALRPAQGQ